MSKETRNCLNCGIQLKRIDKRQKTQCCSRECRRAFVSVELTCDCCGKKFSRRKAELSGSKSNRYYCSIPCQRKGSGAHIRETKRVECVCEICGKVTMRPPSLKHLKYCSKPCRNEGMKIIMSRGGAKTDYGTQIKESRGKTFEHTIIVEKFLGETLRDTGAMIIHLDGDYYNNDIDNLYLFRSESEFWKSEKSMSHPSRSNIRDIKKHKQAKPST